MPTVSLLVPLYGSSPYLDRLAADIAAQTRPFDEVLTYDDCSPDDSATKAERLGLKVLRASISGRQSAARNRLLENSTSSYVHFHDHDDPIHPRFVERMLSVAGNRTIAICDFDEVRGSKVQTHTFEKSIEDAPYELVFRKYVHVNAMLVSRDLALQSGGFDEGLTLCEEKDFLYKLLAVGGKVSILPEKLAEWKIQRTSSMNEQGWIGAARMLRKFIRNCAMNVQPEASHKMLEYCFSSAWNYYYAEPSTLSELRLMFRELRSLGYKPRAGLGRKMERLCALLGPVNALRLRRVIASTN